MLFKKNVNSFQDKNYFESLDQLISLLLSSFHYLASSVSYLQSNIISPRNYPAKNSANDQLSTFQKVLFTRNFIKPPSMDNQTTRGI